MIEGDINEMIEGVAVLAVVVQVILMR